MARQPAYLYDQFVPSARAKIGDCSSSEWIKKGKVYFNLPLSLLWLYWLRYPIRCSAKMGENCSSRRHILE
jgi:hypothetical protein